MTRSMGRRRWRGGVLAPGGIEAAGAQSHLLVTTAGPHGMAKLSPQAAPGSGVQFLLVRKHSLAKQAEVSTAEHLPG